MAGAIIYFDGLCNLCDRFVRFVVEHDRVGRYRVAPLQGETARARLPAASITPELGTVLLAEGERLRTRSDAALAILAGLGGIWRLTVVLRAVPGPWRDRMYDYVARKRFDWFGRRDACRMPTEEERERFLP